MRFLPTFALTLALTAPVFTQPVLAQEDDKGWLTSFLEENLSGAGRAVSITGFTGALSSRATMTRLTIADDQGIWLELDNVVLDWSRTALLSGEVIVNELSAEKIVLTRIPAGEEDTTITPEAQPFEFSLPDLPVSIDIGEVRADSIVLGETVLGQPLEGTLLAKLHLADGDGTAELKIERTDDGPQGVIALDGSYSNASGQLVLDLEAHEGAGGIVSTMLDLPGAPAAGLVLKGQGTLDDFAADFALESDGQERLAGPVTLRTDETGARAFAARFKGNPAPLFLPEYAGFLGDALSLDVAGTSQPDGRLELDELVLDSRALRLAGTVILAADGLPERLDLTGAVALADGSPVLLPISGPNETRISRADLVLAFDAAKGSEWSLKLDMLGLDRPDLTLDRAALNGSGTIDRLDALRGVDGTLDFVASGFGALDPAVLSALGDSVTGRTKFAWREGDKALNLPEIVLNGTGYGLEAALKIEGLGEALRTSGRIEVKADDLARFSALAGRPLGGTATVRLTGEASALTGGFDVDLDVRGRGLKSGIAEADRLLAGDSVITASVVRDETGTALRSLSATAATLKLTAEGRLSSSHGNSLTGRLDWASLSDLGQGYGGALNATAGFEGTPENATITLDGTGRNLRIGQTEVDRLITGNSDISAQMQIKDGVARLVSILLDGQNLSADVRGEGDDGTLRVSGRLRDLALLTPEFPGPVTLSGRLTPQGDGYNADLRVQGPASIDARVSGLISGTAPDLSISGTGNAAAANGFTDPTTLAGTLAYDIRLTGWTPSDATGRVTLSGGRIAVPARGLSLERVAVAADLSGGSARLAVTADVPRGGRIRLDGPVSLASPYSADLSLRIDGVKMRDPELYDTTLDGGLRLSGPLLGQASLSGRIDIGETEIRVPSTGFATAADLETIRHVGDSAEVRATRVRAGGETATSGASSDSSGSSLNWLVNLEIMAPSRVFIRGRGLDAELGGAIRVGGTLSNLVPSGGLDLIRGRLDILGKRLDLTTASLVLQGDFVPWLTIVASNVTDDVTSIVTIEGPADDPEVTFSADPDMPQEEVLAWLLFGRGLDTISAFQAVQLANAVATLAGKGGEGIVGKLRKGFGFDDLDVSTSDDGSASVKAGKYIAKNVYTEVGVDQSGNTRINLNLDVRPGVTVKGRVDSDGESGIGIFLEKDY